MKFKVLKYNSEGEDEYIEGAVWEKYNHFDIRTCKDFEEFDRRFGKEEGTWLSKGVRHCINKDGHIQREWEDWSAGWFLEINSMEELIKLQEKYRQLVVEKCWDNPNLKQISIGMS